MKLHQQHGRPRRAWFGLITGVILLLLAQAATGGAASAATGARTSGTPVIHNVAMDTVARMQPGWNLGNTLDAIPNETSWGNPLTGKPLIDYIKAQGFRSIRIPVTWADAQSATAPYTIDPALLTRVKQVVDWALADGLYVDLNLHHDSWEWVAAMPTDHDAVLARYNATWTQIAATFRDEPKKLVFESINEPSFTNATGDAQKMQLLDELQASFHSIVRQSGGRNATRLLVLTTPGGSPDQTYMVNLAARIKALNDPNLSASVHYYGYWPFSVNIAGSPTLDAVSQKDLVDAFGRMRDIFTSQGIPVYLGEYGLLSEPNSGTVERGEMLKYYQMVADRARAAHVTTVLWDDGNYLDRSALTWRDPALINWIKASYTTYSGTVSTDQVFVPRSGTATAQTLTLDLNGTTFRGLWNGDSKLVRGRDYAESGDRLTLTAALLAKLTGSKAYGVNATLRVRFSKGIPWQLNVLTYDTPVLSNATATIDSTSTFSIPTRFNGDRLATMQGAYADGTGAGSASWTTYQQFTYDFAPNYAGNALTLNATFLAALKDGVPATLTFHFWSGALVTYHVTRTGSTVTGTVS